MQPGSVVVCVNDSKWTIWATRTFSSLPVKGEFYVVRQIFPNIYWPSGPPGIALEEIRGIRGFYSTYYGTKVFMERHFKLARFKEVVPYFEIESALLNENDISISNTKKHKK